MTAANTTTRFEVYLNCPGCHRRILIRPGDPITDPDGDTYVDLQPVRAAAALHYRTCVR